MFGERGQTVGNAALPALGVDLCGRGELCFQMNRHDKDQTKSVGH